jgi:hypothetical protein
MTTEHRQDRERDLPHGLSKPAMRALEGAGYHRLEQLANVRESDILRMHGMGPKGIRTLRAALAERDLSFANADGA